MGKYFETIWGSKEFLRFVCILCIATFGCSMLSMVVAYAVTLEVKFMFGVQANGLGGLLCGLVVAFKQAVPEHSVEILDIARIRVKRIPSFIFLAHLVLFLCRMIYMSFFMETFGMVAAWIYIRFYKMQDGVKGDRSEAFSFTSFFPDFMEPLIKPVSRSVFNLMVRVKVIPGLQSKTLNQMEQGTVNATQKKPEIGSEQADAERRK